MDTNAPGTTAQRAASSCTACAPLQAGDLLVRIAGREAMPGLRDTWARLADSMAFPTPFASWEWADAWLDSLGRSAELRLLIVERDGVVKGLLPLATSDAAAPGFARLLTLCGSDGANPDHLEIIAASHDAPACIEAAFAALTAGRKDWDCVRIPMVAEASAMLAAMGRLAPLHRIEYRQVSAAPCIAVRGSWEDHLGSLSGNERHKIRSRTRKLIAGRGVQYAALDEQGPAAALAILRRLHAKRAVQKGISSSFDVAAVQDFHERFLGDYPRERVLFRCLRRDEEIFAMFYGFRVAGRIFYFQLGYDPVWSDASPGLVLLSETIREAFDSGCTEYNFLQGDEPFKSTWTKQRRALHDCRIYRPSVRGRLYCELRHLRHAARSVILRALRRVGAGDR